MEALETVRNLETALADAKKQVAKQLRASRVSLNLSLREAGRKVKLTQGALHNIETNKSWKIQTVAKIVRVYERLAA